MHLFRHIKPFHSNSHSYSPMGATISDFGSGRARRSPDCVINGFEYRIDGTYYSRTFSPFLNCSEFGNWRRAGCGEEYAVSTPPKEFFRCEEGSDGSALFYRHPLEESVHWRDGGCSILVIASILDRSVRYELLHALQVERRGKSGCGWLVPLSSFIPRDIR